MLAMFSFAITAEAFRDLYRERHGELPGSWVDNLSEAELNDAISSLLSERWDHMLESQWPSIEEIEAYEEDQRLTAQLVAEAEAERHEELFERSVCRKSNARIAAKQRARR